MDRRELIQNFIDKRNYKNYLEIGVCSGYVLDNINVQKKNRRRPQYIYQSYNI